MGLWCQKFTGGTGDKCEGILLKNLSKLKCFPTIFWEIHKIWGHFQNVYLNGRSHFISRFFFYIFNRLIKIPISFFGYVQSTDWFARPPTCAFIPVSFLYFQPTDKNAISCLTTSSITPPFPFCWIYSIYWLLWNAISIQIYEDDFKHTKTSGELFRMP